VKVFYVIMLSEWIETNTGRVELFSVCLSGGSV
jgi:hypothetical protein